MSDERQFLELKFTVSTVRPGQLALYEPVTASEFLLVKVEYVEALETRLVELETRLAAMENLTKAKAHNPQPE